MKEDGCEINRHVVIYIKTSSVFLQIIAPRVHKDTLREESSQTNVILQYKLLSEVCSVNQQS